MRKMKRRNEFFVVLDQLQEISNAIGKCTKDSLYKMVVEETDLSLDWKNCVDGCLNIMMRRYCFAFQFHYTFTLVNDRNSFAFGFIETFSETSVMLKLAVLQGKLGEVAFVSEYRLSMDSRNNKRHFILILVLQYTTISFSSFVMINSDLIVSFLLRNTVERILTISFFNIHITCRETV